MTNPNDINLDQNLNPKTGPISVPSISSDQTALNRLTQNGRAFYSHGTSSYIDARGMVSLPNFNNGVASQAVGFDQAITGTTDTPFTAGTLSFIVSRPAYILFLLDYNTFWTTSGTMSHNSIVKMNLDGTLLSHGVDQMMFNSTIPGFIGTNAYDSNNQTSHHIHNLSQVGSGTHAFTATGAIGSINGPLGTLVIYQYRMSYIRLGQ